MRLNNFNDASRKVEDNKIKLFYRITGAKQSAINAAKRCVRSEVPAGGKSSVGEMSAMICCSDKSSWQTGTDPPEAATISVSNYYDILHRPAP